MPEAASQVPNPLTLNICITLAYNISHVAFLGARYVHSPNV